LAANGFIGDFIMGRFYVLELLYQVLHRKSLEDITVGSSTVRFIYASEVMRPFDVTEPVTEYFYVLCSYQITLLETSV